MRTSTSGETPLLVALDRGVGPHAEFLVSRGASLALGPTAPRRFQKLRLLLLSLGGDSEAFRAALASASPAEVNARTRCKRPALSFAAERGDAAVLRLLLEAGAEVDAVDTVDEQGWTPLLWAVYRGHEECVRLLLDAGADANRRNEPQDPLAQESGNALFWALYWKQTPLTSLLMEHGASALEADGGPGVSMAAAAGATEVVSHLRVAGQPVDFLDAVRSGSVALVTELLDAGADVNYREIRLGGSAGLSALIYAAGSDDVAMVRLLLERGADANLPLDNGWSPLRTAADCGFADVVRVLLDAGADPLHRDDEGQTALDEAIRWKNDPETVAILQTVSGSPA